MPSNNSESLFTDALWVKSDREELSETERSEAKKRLADDIVRRIQKSGECHLRCLGARSLYKAVLALTLARGIFTTCGDELCWLTHFISCNGGGKTMTGIGIIAVSGESRG